MYGGAHDHVKPWGHKHGTAPSFDRANERLSMKTPKQRRAISMSAPNGMFAATVSLFLITSASSTAASDAKPQPLESTVRGETPLRPATIPPPGAPTTKPPGNLPSGVSGRAPSHGQVQPRGYGPGRGASRGGFRGSVR